MGRKGLSHEEKRQKVMEIFYEKKDFFQLKVCMYFFFLFYL